MGEKGLADRLPRATCALQTCHKWSEDELPGGWPEDELPGGVETIRQRTIGLPIRRALRGAVPCMALRIRALPVRHGRLRHFVRPRGGTRRR